MVFLVTDVYKSECICGDAPRVVKLAVASALTAECPQEPALRVKDLEQRSRYKNLWYLW